VENRSLKQPPPKMIGGTWGTHLILPMRPNGPHGPLYAPAKRDGRPFFLLPWDGRLLVGTTDVKFTGNDPDGLKIQDWEIAYLLDETNHLFPGAAYTAADIQATTVGIRPLPATGDKAAGAITRRHFLVDHAKKHGIQGLASVVGGKLTTYRSLAEDVVDWALRALDKPPVPCPTAVVGDVPPMDILVAEARAMLTRLGLDADHSVRLVSLYGPAYADVLRRVEQDPTLGEPLGPNTPDLAAQVVHSVEAEEARTVDDIVHRRLMHVPATEEAIAGMRRVLGP
jgi:glycerol-3-phosphate dehydrogenase